MINFKKHKYKIGLGLFFLYLLLKNKTPMNDFFNNLVKYILKMEGGLSNDPTDSASSFSSPTPQKYHTNKGVTYRTFVDNATKLNYLPTIDNFLKMPNEIWLKIYKDIYLSKALSKNLTDNEILNAYISLWYWGGWSTSIISLDSVKSVLNENISNKEKLKKLVNLRISYFNKLVQAKPTYKIYLKGWTNRANEFYQQFNNYLN
jgi:lysozyme family protein